MIQTIQAFLEYSQGNCIWIRNVVSSKAKGNGTAKDSSLRTLDHQGIYFLEEIRDGGRKDFFLCKSLEGKVGIQGRKIGWETVAVRRPTC